MKNKDLSMDVVDFAYQIIGMDRTITAQAAELERLRGVEERYNELLSSSLKHGQHMMHNLLNVLMTPGVADAFVNAPREGQGEKVKVKKSHSRLQSHALRL